MNRVCDLCKKPWNRCQGHGRGTVEPINPVDFADNPEELMVQREIRRMGIENAPCPQVCPGCGGDLEESGGYVGETIVFCSNEACDKGILWEDGEDAIRRAI